MKTLRKTKAVLCLILSLCMMALVGCGSSSAPNNGSTAAPPSGADSGNAGEVQYNWKFAVSEGTESVQAYWATTFIEELEKINPNIHIDLFYGGQLGEALDCNEMCINGQIELVSADPANMSNFIPALQIFSMHFLFPDDDEVVDTVLDSADVIKNTVSDLYDQSNLTLLAMHNLGWAHWTSNRPIQKVEDFSGMKVRVMQSPFIMHMYECYGANPTPMAFSETYSGLQLGTVEAEENPAQSIVEAKFYEVQKYMTLSGHFIMPGAMAANKAFFDGLPAEIQDQIWQAAAAAQEALPAGRAAIDEAKMQEIRELSKMEILELDPAERARFAEAVQPAIDFYISEYGGDVGAELVQELKDAIADTQAALGK